MRSWLKSMRFTKPSQIPRPDRFAEKCHTLSLR
jgi:hypothetical protein